MIAQAGKAPHHTCRSPADAVPEDHERVDHVESVVLLPHLPQHFATKCYWGLPPKHKDPIFGLQWALQGVPITSYSSPSYAQRTTQIEGVLGLITLPECHMVICMLCAQAGSPSISSKSDPT